MNFWIKNNFTLYNHIINWSSHGTNYRIKMSWSFMSMSSSSRNPFHSNSTVCRFETINAAECSREPDTTTYICTQSTWNTSWRNKSTLTSRWPTTWSFLIHGISSFSKDKVFSMKTQGRLWNISSNQWNSSSLNEKTNCARVFFRSEFFSTEEGTANCWKLAFLWQKIFDWDWYTMHHTECFDSITTFLLSFLPFFIFLFGNFNSIFKILFSW